MWFTRVSINHPVFATMMMVAIMVLGLFSYWTVPSSPVAFMLPCARYQVAGHGGGICA